MKHDDFLDCPYLRAVLGCRPTEVYLCSLYTGISVRREFDEVLLIELGGIVVHDEAAIDFDKPETDKHCDREASENGQRLMAILRCINRSNALSGGVVVILGNTRIHDGLSIAVEDGVE